MWEMLLIRQCIKPGYFGGRSHLTLIPPWAGPQCLIHIPLSTVFIIKSTSTKTPSSPPIDWQKFDFFFFFRIIVIL